MLTAGVLALSLFSCKKQEGPESNSVLKSIDVTIQNASLTKGLAGDKILSGDAVQVNDFKIFLTDAQGNEYDAKEVDGVTPAQTYWSSADLSQGGIDAAFHYVSPNCTQVVAIANIGKDITYAEYKALENLKIENQQDQKNLVLFDVKTLVPSGDVHNDQTNDGVLVSQLYTADILLTPRVSRFEVDGFNISFDPTDPKFEEVRITQLAIQNYYPETNIVTGTEAGTLVNPITNFNDQAQVYNWLDDPTQPVIWSRDYFDITLTPSNPIVDTPEKLAYHLFSCDQTPVFVIKLIADGQPAYLYSKGFYKASGELITEFNEGTIYRMSAMGEVNSDGSLPFTDDDIDPMDRCIEITVEVVEWAVELVYPEF